MEAVDELLAAPAEFEVDAAPEMFVLTFNPGGFRQEASVRVRLFRAGWARLSRRSSAMRAPWRVKRPGDGPQEHEVFRR
jgi:hypothetical protein